MTDEISQRAAEQLQQEMQNTEVQGSDAQLQAQGQQPNAVGAVRCPLCGTANDANAMYCASCGALLHMGICPNCGSEMDPEADFCEVCHNYTRHDVCSFCGAQLSSDEAFCHECSSPRGGIVCPTCHTLNEFSFCKQCGTPLNDEARQLMEKIKAMPEYQELAAAALEYNDLEMQLPYTSDRDRMREQSCDQLRERVLQLLAKDAGYTNIVLPPPSGNERVSQEELNARKAEMREKISQLLNKMAAPPQLKPAQVRNYAMAQKPVGVRLAWLCNYKQAMHSSPCGCAKPQLGGKWVVLGHKQVVKDDK